jgi:hypothetical protein
LAPTAVLSPNRVSSGLSLPVEVERIPYLRRCSKRGIASPARRTAHIPGRNPARCLPRRCMSHGSVHRCLRNRSSRLFDQHPQNVAHPVGPQNPRHQVPVLLLFNWACSLLAVLGAGICGFSLMPMFLALGVVAEGSGIVTG